MDGLNCRAVVGTSCVNTGIDHHNVRLVQRAGIPRCIVTSIQEGGRNARKDGMTGEFIIYAEWTSFVRLLLLILIPFKNNTEKSESDGVNSVIEAMTPEGKRKRAERAKVTPTRRTKSTALSRNTQRENVVDAYNNLVDSVSLYCLPGYGCIHVRTECFQHYGQLKLPPNNAPRCTIEPCMNKCYVCTGGFSKYFLPVIREGAITFLRSRRFSDAYPFPMAAESCNAMLETLSKCKDSLVKVFGKTTVPRYQVAGFFLSLIGSRILVFEWSGSGVTCIISRDSDGICYFELPIAWKGFTFRTSSRRRSMHSEDNNTITDKSNNSIGV